MKKSVYVRVLLRSVLLIMVGATVNCSQAGTKDPAHGSAVQVIESAAQLSGILNSSGGRLLMFDLYADWCLPCRQLSPILEKVATDLKSSVTFYKINIDKHPDIASLFQVTGVPFVVFVKDKKAVQAFMGLQPEAAYRRAIVTYGGSASDDRKDQPDGELVDGVRVITLSTATTIGNLYVYRGEEVMLLFGKVDFPYSIHIPSLKASGSAKAGENLSVGFKAKESGVFSMMCNGKCPAGDGQQFAKIVVLEYAGDTNTAIFKNVNAKEARSLISSGKPLLLDVRTPSEYYEGHIAGATLIPLQQLVDRIDELDAYKNRPILVYCHSGNRSIPASQILISNGFKKVYNLRHGILEWTREKLPLEKTL